jgi:hypothetical protein
MGKKARRRLRPWQRFLVLADEDLLAFAVLYESKMMGRAFYCAQQAVEKYLKALILKKRQKAKQSTAIYKSRDRKKRPRNAWLFGHELAPLLTECRRLEPYYRIPANRKQLRRISSFETMARYPSRKWRFSSTDVDLVARLAHRIRGDLRVRDDYYPLAKGLMITKEFAAEERTCEQEAAFLHNMIVQTPWGPSALALRRLWLRVGRDPHSLVRL